MAGVCNVVLLGDLTADPVSREVDTGGNRVCTFRLACSRKFKGADGNDREEVCYIDVEAWGRVGEIVQQYRRKGGLLFVWGRLRTAEWEKDGQRHSKICAVAGNVQLVGDNGPAHLPNSSVDSQRTQPQRRSNGPQSPAATDAQRDYDARRNAARTAPRTNGGQGVAKQAPAANRPANRNVMDGAGFDPDADLGPLRDRFGQAGDGSGTANRPIPPDKQFGGEDDIPF